VSDTGDVDVAAEIKEATEVGMDLVLVSGLVLVAVACSDALGKGIDDDQPDLASHVLFGFADGGEHDVGASGVE
jgi:hypothetical protein